MQSSFFVEDTLFCAIEMDALLLLLLLLLKVLLPTRKTNDILVSKFLFTSITSFKNQKQYTKPTKIHLTLAQNWSKSRVRNDTNRVFWIKAHQYSLNFPSLKVRMHKYTLGFSLSGLSFHAKHVLSDDYMWNKKFCKNFSVLFYMQLHLTQK